MIIVIFLFINYTVDWKFLVFSTSQNYFFWTRLPEPLSLASQPKEDHEPRVPRGCNESRVASNSSCLVLLIFFEYDFFEKIFWTRLPEPLSLQASPKRTMSLECLEAVTSLELQATRVASYSWFGSNMIFLENFFLDKHLYTINCIYMYTGWCIKYVVYTKTKHGHIRYSALYK